MHRQKRRDSPVVAAADVHNSPAVTLDESFRIGPATDWYSALPVDVTSSIRYAAVRFPFRVRGPSGATSTVSLAPSAVAQRQSVCSSMFLARPASSLAM